MPDVHDTATRSRNMAAIRGKHTGPELIVRRLLHAGGFRFRLHDAKLPGKPDLVLRKYGVVIFVQGCFWHGHHCHLFKIPSSRREFWLKKIGTNQANDQRNHKTLLENDYRVMDIWECALKGKMRLSSDRLLESMTRWILSDQKTISIEGSPDI